MSSTPKREPGIVVIARGIGKAALIMLLHPVRALLFGWNVSTSPRVPWAALVMIALLWLVWEFLNGRIGPQSSRQFRASSMKWRPQGARVWIWSLMAGGSAMIAMAMIETHSVQCGWVTNSALSGEFGGLPQFTAVAFMVVTSLLAALVEESAFRGYMQSDLEQRFSMPVTIAIVAVTFAAFHLYGRTLQQWTAGLADWIVISAIFSGLVWMTGSIVPAVVCHFAIDVALFSLDWFNDPLLRLRAIVPGLHVSAGAVVCFISALASLAAFRKLAAVCRQTATLSP